MMLFYLVADQHNYWLLRWRRTGKIILAVLNLPKNQKKDWFNFLQSQFIPDQNNDGQEDIFGIQRRQMS